jgi:hypothetical protein
MEMQRMEKELSYSKNGNAIKIIHCQLFFQVFQSNGLTNQNDMTNLGWLFKKKKFRIMIYKST